MNYDSDNLHFMNYSNIFPPSISNDNEISITVKLSKKRIIGNVIILS